MFSSQEKLFEYSPNLIALLHESNNSFKVFYHSLKVAYSLKAILEIFDVRREREIVDYLSVRAVFEQWSLLPPNSSRENVAELGICIKKKNCEGNKTKEVECKLQNKPYDLFFIGAGSKTLSWNMKSYLNVLLKMKQSFIHFPNSSAGLVDENSGEYKIKTILFPIFAKEQISIIEKAALFFHEIIPNAQTEQIAIPVNLEAIEYQSESEMVTLQKVSIEKNEIKTLHQAILAIKPDLCVLALNNRITNSELKKNIYALIKKESIPIAVFLI